MPLASLTRPLSAATVSAPFRVEVLFPGSWFIVSPPTDPLALAKNSSTLEVVSGSACVWSLCAACPEGPAEPVVPTGYGASVLKLTELTETASEVTTTPVPCPTARSLPF